MGDAALRVELNTVKDAAGSATVAFHGAEVCVAARWEVARRDGAVLTCEVEAAGFDAPEICGDDVARALQSCLAAGGPKATIQLRAVVRRAGRGELGAACMAASLALAEADVPMCGLCGGSLIDVGKGVLSIVAAPGGVVASALDGAVSNADAAAALDGALRAAEDARAHMRAALVARHKDS
jgi:hypothetical protein